MKVYNKPYLTLFFKRGFRGKLEMKVAKSMNDFSKKNVIKY